jgi:hypothetical protein
VQQARQYYHLPPQRGRGDGRIRYIIIKSASNVIARLLRDGTNLRVGGEEKGKQNRVVSKPVDN